MKKSLERLRQAVLRRDGAVLADSQLLESFIAWKDEAAFEALVRRHGPMIMGVCRRVLRHHQDAEDAFQATFLVLARKAASIASRELLANWLYGVAHNTAIKARALIDRRRTRERQVAEMPDREAPSTDAWLQCEPLLDQELSRLPEKYRVAIVLCDLEGKTRREAAQRLGWPEGTVASRLATARNLLAKRLARHGLAWSGAALAAALTQRATAELPASVVSVTVKAATSVAAGQVAATGLISSNVAALADGVLKAMLLSKLKTATVVLIGTALLGASVTMKEVLFAPAAAQPQAAAVDNPRNIAENDQERLQGTWVPESGIAGGKQLPAKTVQSIRFTFKGNQVTFEVFGSLSGEHSTGEFRVAPSRRPKTIQMFIHGKTVTGLYELAGDKLKLTYSAPGQPAPTDFEGKDEALALLLKRTTRPNEVQKVAPKDAPGHASPPSRTNAQAKAPAADKAKNIEEPAAFANPLGWSWYEAPKEHNIQHWGGGARSVSSISGRGYSVCFDVTHNGACAVYLAYRETDSVVAYRPVGFDATRKRYDFQPGGSSGQNAMMLARYELDPKLIPAGNKPFYLGIELLTKDGVRIRARDAMARAEKEGIEVLPFPELNAPYEFTLSTTDGKHIRSRDLLGKVVLIDCWATWCSPCMAIMPGLKELYENHHKGGLEIVGLCFDTDAGKANKAITSEALPWPQVLLPANAKARELWNEAAATGCLPRLLLIDRAGVLRGDVAPDELREKIVKLLGENPSR